MMESSHFEGGQDGEPLLRTEASAKEESAAVRRRRAASTSPFIKPTIEDFVETANDAWRYQQAAIYLREGSDHSKFAYHPQTPEAVSAYMAVNSVWLNVIDMVAGIVLMLLALFEDPPICKTCSNINATAVVEILCLLTVHLHTIFYFRWKGKAIFKERKLILKIALTIEMLVEAIVVLARQKHHLRFMRAFRPIFIIDNKFATGIKRVLYEMIQSLPPVIEILVLLITFITTFAVMGYYIFGTQRTDEFTNDSHNWYFYSFQDSWVNLFILLTTANYPDVMMPAYRDNRWACLFFIFYLMFALYFLGNLLLAAVYSNFNTKEKDKFGRLYIHRRQGLRKAFQVLDVKDTGKIDYTAFRGCVLAYMGTRWKQELEIVCMFKSMDPECTGSIDLQRWFSLYEVNLYSWAVDRGSRSGLFCAIDDYPPQILPFFQVLNKIVRHAYFEYFIDLCIVINAAFLIAEAALTTDQNKDDHAIADYEQVFVAIYTVEAVMKICGLGLRGYFSKGFNIFDFIIVAVSLIGQIVERRTIYVTILRPFRLFRLFKLRKSFNYILSSMFNIMPRLTRFVLALVCVYYFFSVIGMAAFSGDISTCGCSKYNGSYQCEAELFQANSQPMVYLNANRSVKAVCNNTVGCTYKVCGGHYSGYYDRSSADGLYYLNNFDDIINSYVVLFELMVVNNWHVTMQGAVSATSSQTTATRAFFIFFYLVTVVIVTNVVVAFILDAFQSLLPTFKAKDEKEEARQKRIEEGGATDEDDEDDDDNKLQTLVYIQRTILESLRDSRYLNKIRKKAKGSLEVKILGSRSIQPIDIYLMIFNDDIGEWKDREEALAGKEPRAMARTFTNVFPQSSGIPASGNGGNTQVVMEMNERQPSSGSMSYAAPVYVPPTITEQSLPATTEELSAADNTTTDA